MSKSYGYFGGDDYALIGVKGGLIELTHSQACRTIMLALEQIEFDQNVRLPELLEQNTNVLNPIVEKTPVSLIHWAAQFLKEMPNEE